MNREEAISIMNVIIHMLEPQYDTDRIEDAVEMAIKALKQEPCEDCVSRKELLKIYEDKFLELQKIKHLKENKGAEDRQMGVNYCINILKEMSSVTPAEKVGRWIVNGETFRCSECGELACCQGRYCNECGAMMQEVES